MLSETGRVVAIDDGAVWVETLRQSACDSCSARAGCGHGLVNSAAASSSRGLVRATVAAAMQPLIALNDTVVISLPERGFLRAASLLYLMPLLGLLAGAALAVAAASGRGFSPAAIDLLAVLGSMAGLAAGLLLLRRQSRARDRDPIYQPRVTGKL